MSIWDQASKYHWKKIQLQPLVLFFFKKKKSRINWKMNFPFHSNFHIPECAHHKHVQHAEISNYFLSYKT